MTLRLATAGRVARARARRDPHRAARRARARPRRDRRRPEAAAGGLRPLAAAADRAGPRRGARRAAPRQDARHAARARRPQQRPQELDVGDEPVAARGRAAGQGHEAGDAAAARPRRPAGVLKYDLDDVRNALERASARHTAVHVAAGGVAKALLGTIGVTVEGSTVDEEALRARIDEARKERDTVGGVVEVRARNVPPGLGTYAAKEDRLDARLAAAVMGIQAVKGVEIGEGFALAGKFGSEAHDEIEHRPPPRDEPRRRDRGGHLERRGDRRPRRDEAAADADEAARARSTSRPARPPRRSSSAPTWPRSRRSPSSPRRRSRGSSRARRTRSSAATRSATSSAAWRAYLERIAMVTERARPARRARRVHGRGQDDARPRAGRAARPAVPRPRPGDRGARRQDRSRSSSRSAARRGSARSRRTPCASRSPRPSRR